MSLQEQLNTEIKDAMRARNADRLGALRMLKSAIGYAQIEKESDTLSDNEFLALVQKEAKKRRDSIAQYEQGGRQELADKEKAELAVLEEFLPKPLTAEELEKLVREVIEETGATSRKDMGTVIRTVQERATGRADGKTISQAVGRLLA